MTSPVSDAMIEAGHHAWDCNMGDDPKAVLRAIYIAMEEAKEEAADPTIASLKTKVERAAREGPDNRPDIGAISHAQRNKHLFDQLPADEIDDALTRQLLLDADEMEACGAGNEAANMRKLVARLKEFRAALSAIRNGDEGMGS